MTDPKNVTEGELEKTKHNRFYREVWAFKSDFTGALAKWLIKQSPYIVPEKLSDCITSFHIKLTKIAEFDTAGMAKIELSGLTKKVNEVLESIPEIMALNESENSKKGQKFVPYDERPLKPNDDFIDTMAVAQNITCEFADMADAQCWLDRKGTIKIDKEKIKRVLVCMEKTVEIGCDDCEYSSGKLMDCIKSDRHVIEILKFAMTKKEI